MKRFYERAMLCALLTAFASPAFAATVDLSGVWGDVMSYVASIVGVAISALVGWVFMLLKTKIGLSIDDSMRASLQAAATNAAGLVLNKLGNALPGSVEISNPLIAEAVQYVLKAAPDAIKHFGLTPDALAEKIVAALPQVANTTKSA